MNLDNTSVERRRHPRFPAPEGAVAADRRSHRLGQIRDISKGGLCFRYIDGQGCEHGTDSVMDIVDTNSSFYLKEVPFRIVADFPVHDTPSFSSLPLRHCSVRFGDLKERQITLLEDFLQRCGL